MASDSTVAELILKIVADSSNVRKELSSVLNAQKDFNKKTEEENARSGGGAGSIGAQIKGATKPLNDLMGAFRRVTALSTLGFAALVATVKSTEKEVTLLRQQAIDLGTSVEALSMKKFGFNIDTEGIKAGTAALTEMLDTWNKLRVAMSAGITEWYGEAYNTFQANLQFLLHPIENADVSWDEMMRRITVSTNNHAKEIKKNSTENLKTQADYKTKTEQLVMDETSFKISQMNKEVAKARAAGVEEMQLAQYKSAFMKRINEDRGVEYLRMQAQLARARGEDMKALQWEQDAELMMYKRKDTAMVASKKAAFEQMRKIEQMNQLGLKQSAQIASDFNKQITGSFKESFSSFFGDAFRGELKSANEYFVDFGNKIIDAWSNMLAEMIVQWMFSKTLLGPALQGFSGFFTGLTAMHSGGYVGSYIKKAHDGLAPGEVPIIAQQGEGVLSRNGMATLGSSEKLMKLNAGEKVGGGQPIVINMAVQAWDSRDIMRNQKSLAQGIGEELRKNGEIRRVMREYA